MRPFRRWASIVPMALSLAVMGCYASHLPADSPGRDAELRGPTDAGADGEAPRPSMDASAPDGCHPLSEVCNGTDDDCDGRVDEGSAEELGCAPGRICRGLCV